MDWLMVQNPVLLALLFTLMTWAITALGAAVVFFFKRVDRRVLNMMLGFASGIMIAASFWSLLAPAIVRAEGGPVPVWLVVALGFVVGALFLVFSDWTIARVRRGRRGAALHGNMRRIFLLVFSITLHNIPEGLAVGVAFGALAAEGAMTPLNLMAAMAVAIGIGLQNFPEGAAVSIPLRREGVSRFKCFMIGQLSAIVEPIAGVLGAALVMSVEPVLPYALAFAAGAMIYVVAEELLPEAQRERLHGSHIASMGCILGFAVMMMLDVALG